MIPNPTTLSVRPRTLLLLNGPNLGLLGSRKPALYGSLTLGEIIGDVAEAIRPAGWNVIDVQSEDEGALVRAVHDHGASTDGAVVNPGALMIAGWSLREALESYEHPWIEVHITNVAAREAFRHHSVLTSIATGLITGLGPAVYRFAALALVEVVDSGQRRQGHKTTEP